MKNQKREGFDGKLDGVPKNEMKEIMSIGSGFVGRLKVNRSLIVGCLLLIAMQLGCKRRIVKPEINSSIVELTIGKRHLEAEVACDPISREQGMMFRKEMPSDGAMLFVFPQSSPRSFWMKNTYLPLSIAFLREDGSIVNIEKMAPLDEVSQHRSMEPVRYALEVHQGWFDEHGFGPGTHVDFKLPRHLVVE